MILNQQPAGKAYYIWAPINQYPSCAFCVENDFESTITWGPMLHLSTQSIPLVCNLCEKWFWINDQLMNHVLFEHQINSQCLSLSPSSSFTSGVHFLPCCLLLENSVPASCVVKIFQSPHGWRCTLFINSKPIDKTSLSPSSSLTPGVCSASVPYSTSGGSGLVTYVKKHR